MSNLHAPDTFVRGAPSYLPSMTSTEYLAFMRTRHPMFAQRLWLDRPGSAEMLARLGDAGNEFESDKDGGRGDSYREAQRDVSIRIEGITRLLTFAGGGRDITRLPEGFAILDVLGGDGTLARALWLLGANPAGTAILTGDIAAQMVQRALGLGLPAVRQPAQFLLLRDESVDAVIIAYGAHHIPPAERQAAFDEAYRVLRPGGVLVAHDFEENGPVARWFAGVVHPYSAAGHDYRHFTSAEMANLMVSAGFARVSIGNVYDPFVARGHDAAAALRRLLEYTGNMYGLHGLRAASVTQDAYFARLEELIRAYMKYDYTNVPEAESWWSPQLDVTREPGGYRVEMPRLALVGRGVK